MPATLASRPARGTSAVALEGHGLRPVRAGPQPVPGSRPGCRRARAVRPPVTLGRRSRPRPPPPTPGAGHARHPPWARPWGEAGMPGPGVGGWGHVGPATEGRRRAARWVPAALAWRRAAGYPAGLRRAPLAAEAPASAARPPYHRPRACGYVWPGPGSRAGHAHAVGMPATLASRPRAGCCSPLAAAPRPAQPCLRLGGQ